MGEDTLGGGVKYMTPGGNYTFGGEDAIEYTDIELQCCMTDMYMMLLTTVNSIHLILKIIKIEVSSAHF